MTAAGSLLLAMSTLIFVFAATIAKSWTLAPTPAKLILTLVLYSVGNLIMLRLVREFGMAITFSLAAIIQLIAINVIALLVYSEPINVQQGIDIALAVVAVGLISFPNPWRKQEELCTRTFVPSSRCAQADPQTSTLTLRRIVKA